MHIHSLRLVCGKSAILLGNPDTRPSCPDAVQWPYYVLLIGTFLALAALLGLWAAVNRRK